MAVTLGPFPALSRFRGFGVGNLLSSTPATGLASLGVASFKAVLPEALAVSRGARGESEGSFFELLKPRLPAPHCKDRLKGLGPARCHSRISSASAAASPERFPFPHCFTPSPSASLSCCSAVVSTSSDSEMSGTPPAPSSLGVPEGYRANVGICLINAEGRVFVASRIDKPGAWQMPQGGIDEGEDPCEAARRELREETGVTSAELLAEAPDWLCYDFPPDVRTKLAVAWGRDWKGQAQKWFLFRFTGKDEGEISLLGDLSERPEFDDWKWMDVPAVIDAAVAFKRPVYEAAFKAFQPFLPGRQSDTT